MSWLLLFVAGLFEIVWAVGLKYTDGFRKPLETSVVVAAMAVSMLLLGLAVRHIPIGTGYAVWTGIGVIGTVICGIVLFGEPIGWQRLLFISLIVVGVLGLKLTHTPSPS